MSGVLAVEVGEQGHGVAGALLYALAAGVLSSAVPFLADLLTLRRVPARFLGVFMSVNPVFATLIGMLVLGGRLAAVSWLAVAVIVPANAVAASGAARPSGSAAHLDEPSRC